MCGIAGFALTKKSHGTFPVSEFARELLLGNEKRGKDATGYVGVILGHKKPKVAYHRMPVPAAEFVKLHTLDRRTHIALLHTRAQTKGDPKFNENNHPVQWNSCFAVHNGSIHNDDDVLVEAGISKEQRVGEVDSFAVPVALDYHGWGEDADIRTSLHMLKGTFAVAAIDPIEKPGRVLLAKGPASPLYILTSPHGIFWSSEKGTLEDAWGKVLGTPPKINATKPHDMGWHNLTEGEYWVVDINTGALDISSGFFNVNRTYPASTTQWRPYTHNDHEWTCWPNEKNCVFSEDCGSCHNDHCECFAGNPSHPVLNDGLRFDDLTQKHTNFKYHAEKFKITKAMVERPTVGVQVVRLPATPNQSTGSTSSRETSDGQSRTTSPPSRGALVPAAIPDTAECFFCENSFPRTTMRELTTIVHGNKMYACTECSEATRSASEPRGYDEAFKPLLKNLWEEARYSEETLETALQETSWEFKLPASLIRYACLINTRRFAGYEEPDFANFIKEVRNSFLGNVKIVQELRSLDKAND